MSQSASTLKNPNVKTSTAPVLGKQEAEERRRARRNPVIKSARLIFSKTGAVHECLVLDESPGGVLVDLGAMIEVPDELTLQFTAGASYLARRCWSAGTKCGLNFTGAQIISDQVAWRMRRIGEILQRQGTNAAVKTLRVARFFDNEDLRRIAEEAEAANARFEAALDGNPVF